MSWKKILKVDEFCDECENRIEDGKSYHVESMPEDFNSGKKGDSATLCEECHDEIGPAPKDWTKDINPFLFMPDKKDV